MKRNKSNQMAPGVKHYNVGKGFTERRRYRIDLTVPLSPAARELFQKQGPKGLNPFDGKIAPAEAAARRILEEAGLPADPEGFYTIPEGEAVPMPPWTRDQMEAVLSRSSQRKAGGLLDLVKDRGYRERIDQEWYAAEILALARMIRAQIADPWTAASLAADLGELVGEAKAHGFFAKAGKKADPSKRKILPLVKWLRDAVKQYPDKPVPFFWNSIPNDDDADRPQRINGAKMIREGGLLLVSYDNGRKQTITYDSFRRYVTDAKIYLKS